MDATATSETIPAAGTIEADQEWRRVLAVPATYILLGVATYVLVASTGGLSWALVGAAIWAASVVGKGLVTFLVIRPLLGSLRSVRTRSRGGLLAASTGLLSAATELGAVLAIALIVPMTGFDAAALGIGAGACEAILLGVAGIVVVMRRRAREAPGERSSSFVHWSGLLERALALIVHVGSRGLVWAGLRSTWLLGLVGFAAFALGDGVVAYGFTRGWDWSNERVLRRVHVFLGVTAGLQLGIFLLVLCHGGI